MTGPVIITAAIVGAELSREDTPYLPLTPEEIALAAAEAAAAGASIIHLHVRDEAGEPTQEAEVFARAIAAIRREADVIVQVSTGGAVGTPPEERLQPVVGLPDGLRPEMASLTTGSCDFGEEVFSNPLPEVRLFAKTMAERGIKPEAEVFDAGMLANAVRLVEQGHVQAPLHVDFVLGVPGAMTATPRNLVFLVESLPAGWTWTVSGIGRNQLAMSALGLVLGGHVRTGFEDNIYYRKGELATSSAQLVARVARLAAELDRPVATVAQAREILGLAG